MKDEPSPPSTAKDQFAANVAMTIMILVIATVGLLFFIEIQDKAQRSDSLAAPASLNEGTRLDPGVLNAESYGLTNLVAPVSGLSSSPILSDTNRVSN